MTPYLLPALLLPAALLFAVPVPKAVDDPAVNLTRYLTYRSEGRLTPACRAERTQFVCKAQRQRIEERDANRTAVTAFKAATASFNKALGVLLQKEAFDAAMKEVEELERLQQQHLAAEKPYFAPPSTPRKDALERALVGNLEQLDVTDFDYDQYDPQAHLHIDTLHFANRMKRTAKGAAFAERVLGIVSLDYAGATLETNATESSDAAAPYLFEAWFDTNDTVRADYVGKRLHALYAEQFASPFSGRLALTTVYEGNDTIDTRFTSRNDNANGNHDTLTLHVTLRNASALFTPARKPPHSGYPDLLFHALHAQSSADGRAYRSLLEKDKRFAAYIGQYDTLLHRAFERKRNKFAYSPTLTRWITEAESAFSALLRGRADTLEINVTNRSGQSTVQLFSLLMGQLTALPSSPDRRPDLEKILADTAAAHLEVRIEAR
ncbi:hypothetical protein WCX72_03615 [Sulfurimonas sp. HSL1-6]|uniref:hypothetical protein n=1 Tax=Thiomicrolovo immobilis TaxID=3131935 RepID=UPI0031F75EF4